MTAAALLALLALTDDGGGAMAPPSDAGVPAVVVTPPKPRGSSLNLLVGLPPPTAYKVENADRMTDGVAPEPGENWKSQWTSVIEKDGSVIWDFGESTAFEGIWIQADNNDVYVVSTSEDAHNFTTVWESLTVDAPGMQARTAAAAHARGRFVKLTAKGGDSSYSVGEFALFADGSNAKPYVPEYKREVRDPPPPFDGNWVVIAIVVSSALYFVRQFRPKPESAEPPPKA